MAVENRKKKKNKMSVPLMIVLVICVVVLGVSIWQLSGIFIEYKKGTDEYDKLQTYVSEEPVEEPVTADTGDGENEDGTEAEGDTEEQVQRVAISELQAQNSDTVGWIQIPGTQISYPLMHTSDDSYYLNHTFSKKLNSAGSIFVETLNNGDFSDLHTIIYGHNMKNGSMFAGLKEYQLRILSGGPSQCLHRPGGRNPCLSDFLRIRGRGGQRQLHHRLRAGRDLRGVSEDHQGTVPL